MNKYNSINNLNLLQEIGYSRRREFSQVNNQIENKL